MFDAALLKPTLIPSLRTGIVKRFVGRRDRAGRRHTIFPVGVGISDAS
jgi:hypothetical protein